MSAGEDDDPGSDRSGRLDAAMVEYLEAVDAGDPIEPGRWLAKYPDLATDLRALLDDQRRIGQLVASTRSDEGDRVEETALHLTGHGSSESRATAPYGAAAVDARGPRDRHFGDYELIKILGRGGMGIVYLAHQVSLDRLVALKMLRSGHLAGEDELHKFRIEAATVARLDHPNLLTIFEVGELDGRCYFSMPLIGGGSLADHPSRYREDPRRAALLVAEIAGAVHHAHQRGILHRDLKPANVLIDEAGRPYVGDFGLAKRIDVEETPSGAILGTPAYMSPEQAAGRKEAVTTASDIYGLGAILYALLTGHNPFPGESVPEILRRVCDEPPEPPSRSNPRVDRGLEAICLKCLEKEPGRRYASAEALADDLARWGEGRPIAARPAGPLDRSWMWCRRKPALAGMALALAASIVAGTAGIVTNWLAVRHQKELLVLANARTEEERDLARAINDFLLEDLLHQSSPLGAPNRALTVEDLLDRSARIVAGRFARRPVLEASIRRILADSYRAAGRLDKADEQIVACLRIMDGTPDVDERERFAAWHAMGELFLTRDRATEALRYLSLAHEGRGRSLGAADVATLDSANLLASAYLALGQVDRAADLLNAAYETSKAAHGEGHRITLVTLGNLAVVAHRRGSLGDAEKSLKTVRDEWIRLSGPDHPETLLAATNLGAVILALGRTAEAEDLLSRTLDASKKVLGDGHHLTLTLANNLAAAQGQLGKLDEAGANLIAVVEGRKSVLGDAHIDTIMARNNLAANLSDRGKFAEAIELLVGILPRLRVSLPPGDPRLAGAIINQAVALQGTGQVAEAGARSAEAVALYRKLPGQGVATTDAMAHQASILLDAREFTRAEVVASEVLAARTTSHGTAPWKVAYARTMLGAALAGKGDFPGAEPLLLGGCEGVRSDPRATPSAISKAIERVALMYEESGRPGMAAPWRAMLGRLGGP